MMLTVCCCVPFSLAPSPPETAEISTIIVSLSSSVESFTPVRVAVPVVAPALIGLLISLPILVAVATVASLTAGQLYIEATIGIASQAFWADVLSVVTMVDLAHCFGKAVLFAFLISLIGIVMGLGVSGGAEVLGRATTSSVVTCIGAIIAADTAVALLL